MAIFGKLKKAFGFSETDYEMEENALPSAAPIRKNIPSDHTAGSKHNLQNPVPRQPTSKPSEMKIPDTAPEYPTTHPDEIFTTVVDIFNNSLPEFIRNSINPDKQRRLIYDSLDESIKVYITKLEDIAQKRTEAAWFNERTKLHTEMENLQIQSRRIEDSNAEWQEQKLSAERQKRALSERVHDLEKQIAKYEAEREQFELENKSLVNKLRATAIQEADIEALTADNLRLKEELSQLKANHSETPQNDSNAVEIQLLKEEFDKQKESIEELSSEITQGQEVIGQLKTENSLLKKKCEIADEMINDLNRRLTASQRNLGEKESLLNETKSALKAAQAIKQTESNTSNETDDKLTEALNEIERLTTELNEANASLNIFETSLDKFEQIKASKDQQISQLQDELIKKDNALGNYKGEIESLKSTIENNLKLQAQSEQALRKEIESMRAVASSETGKPKRQRKPKITSIDESLDDTDWLVATPPEGTDARPSRISDEEFGYHEPPRKDNPSENSSQMLLW